MKCHAVPFDGLFRILNPTMDMCTFFCNSSSLSQYFLNFSATSTIHKHILHRNIDYVYIDFTAKRSSRDTLGLEKWHRSFCPRLSKCVECMSKCTRRAWANSRRKITFATGGVCVFCGKRRGDFSIRKVRTSKQATREKEC